MNLYELASQDEAWGAYAPVDDATPLSAWPADPPAPMPLDAALDAAALEYGVDADVLRALGHGGSVDSIFDTAASLRSRLEAFDGDYAQALASYRWEEEGNAGDALAAPAAAPLSPPALADAQVPAPGPAPTPAPSARPRPARPQAAAPVPGAPPSQATRPDQPPAPPDGRLGAADDPRSLVYRQVPAAQKSLVDAASSQPGSGTDTASFAPARPKVRQALGNTWDAASPGERQRMQSMPGWQGQLARERAAQYAQADKGVLAASPTAALLDGRAESRAKAQPAAGAAPRTGGNDRAQAPSARPSAVPAVAVEPASLTQRSWGEAFSDTTKSVAQGLLDVASLPGVAYSAATGDYDTSYLNAIRGTQEVLQDEKSPALQAQAQALQQKLATAEGWREKLAVGGWETLKNPTLLGDTLARSGPGMLAGGLLGRAAGGAVDAAGNALLGRTIATGSEAAARSAVALKNAAPAMASGTAVGASAAQQGASVANDLYAELRKLPASAFAAEPEFQQLAREHGPDKARDILAAAATTRALLVGTGASVLSMKLVPGGDAIEKVFLPSHLKGGAAREAVKSSSFLTQPLTRGMQGNLGTQALEIAVQGLKHGTTGSIIEGAEEASGAVAKGLELSRAGQDVKLGDMAGEAAGQGMAAGFAMDGAAGTRGANAAPRVQDQPTWPSTPPTSPPPTATAMARGQTAPEAPTASGPAAPPPPSSAAALAAALLPGYSEALQPGNEATWSNAASATRKAQAEAEILRQAEALPARDAATATTTAPTLWTTPAGPLPASTDGNRSSTLQGADALQQGQVNRDADQAETATQATATDPADTPAPTTSVAGAQVDASATADTAPATTEHGTARHTAASQVQPPATAPADAQIQALDSGMLVVGGDQATILTHLQAGGVRGAEPFAGVTLVPVDQAALAQQVLSRPLAASAGPVGTQEDRGSQRASTTAALPQARIAAQFEPAATQAPTDGGSTASPSPVGASAPRTEGRHGSPASAAASQPVPVMEMQRDGTLMVKGDPIQLQERLRQGGVDRVLLREGGVVVGLDQVGKVRQLLQQQPPRAQTSGGPAPTGQQFSRSAPDQASQARGLPSKPATVQSVRAAVAKLTNSMGLLAEGRGRVVVATSAAIKAHWEPLVGEVDIGSQDTGLAQGFFDPNSKTVFLIADHIEAGQEMAVAAHELVHKYGKAVLGEKGWRQLHVVIGTWENRPEGSLERQVYDEAAVRVQGSRPTGADEASYSSEELFPYAVQVAMELGVQPTALMPNNSVQGWLARVRASLKDVLSKLTGNPQAFDGQDLVDLAFAVAQREISRYPFTASNTAVRGAIAGTNATSDAEVAVLQFSRSPGTKAAFEARIEALFAGDKPRGIHRGEQAAIVLDRSDMLEFLRITNGPVYLDEAAVGKPDRGLPRGSPPKHPNMTAEQWKNVPQWLETPAAVFDSDTVTGDLVLIAPALVDGAIVMMTINPKAQGNGPGVTVGLLTNAYDKDGGPPPVGKWAREGKAWYVDKKVLPDVLRRVGVQSSDAFQNKPGTRRILTDRQFGGWKKENRSDF